MDRFGGQVYSYRQHDHRGGECSDPSADASVPREFHTHDVDDVVKNEKQNRNNRRDSESALPDQGPKGSTDEEHDETGDRLAIPSE